MNTRDDVIQKLNEKYPKLTLDTSEAFNQSNGGIWVKGTENGITAKDGKKLFNYYAEQKIYELGVHNEINKFVEKLGWYFEWYDCGTIFIYEN
jgi:hypothetical protein